MWNAIKMVLGLAKQPSAEATCLTFDESCAVPRHLKPGDRVIYRAGVFKDQCHPNEGRVGTLDSARLLDTAQVIGEKPYAVAIVHFDGDAAPTPVNARNVITLLDWLVEREKTYTVWGTP